MDSFEQISDVLGEVLEGISDVAVDVAENVGDFSKETLEHFDETGVKELKAGNLEGALNHSDFPDKETLKEVADIFHLDKDMMVAGTKMIGGALVAVSYIATPGLQVAGIAAVGTAMAGVFEFKEAWDNNREAKAAAALSEYGTTV